MDKNTVHLRPITQQDNVSIAYIIRSTLTEFNAARPGTVYYDESTDRLSEIFCIYKANYFVVEYDGVLLGGAGIYPTDGLGDTTCELVKMYLLPRARGLGLGKMLIDQCISCAKQAGFTKIYLETMPELTLAIALYERTGFQRLSAPLGISGHFGCDIWMAKEL